MTDDEKLRRALDDEPEFCGDNIVLLLRAEVLRLRHACIVQQSEIVNTLAEGLGYQDDPETGLPTYGDHVAETLAIEAARKLKAMGDELDALRLLLARKNCALDVFALDVFASPQMWDQPRMGEYVWQGDNEYRNPITFAAKERDADEPTD